MTDKNSQHPTVMPETNYPRFDTEHRDEIDLMELLSVLWRKKVLIIICTFVCTILAGAYAFTAKEVWTSKAYITAPRIENTNDLMEYRRAFVRAGIIDNSMINNTALFADFLEMAASPDSKIAFLSGTDFFKKETKGDDPLAKQRWLEKATDEILVITPPDEKKKFSSYVVSMSADNPVVAKNMLVSYINQVNTNVVSLNDKEFRYTIDGVVAARKQEAEDITFNLESKRKTDLSYLALAISIAQQAGIKNYFFSTDSASSGGNMENIKSYMLGEKLLGTEIDKLKNTPIILPVKYYEIERQLALVEPLLKKNVSTQSYRYLLAPAEPTTKDKPKKALILILGVLVGGILGCGIALMQSATQRYRSKTGKA